MSSFNKLLVTTSTIALVLSACNTKEVLRTVSPPSNQKIEAVLSFSEFYYPDGNGDNYYYSLEKAPTYL